MPASTALRASERYRFRRSLISSGGTCNAPVSVPAAVGGSQTFARSTPGDAGSDPVGMGAARKRTMCSGCSWSLSACCIVRVTNPVSALSNREASPAAKYTSRTHSCPGRIGSAPTEAEEGLPPTSSGAASACSPHSALTACTRTPASTTASGASRSVGARSSLNARAVGRWTRASTERKPHSVRSPSACTMAVFSSPGSAAAPANQRSVGTGGGRAGCDSSESTRASSTRIRLAINGKGDAGSCGSESRAWTAASSRASSRASVVYEATTRSRTVRSAWTGAESAELVGPTPLRGVTSAIAAGWGGGSGGAVGAGSAFAFALPLPKSLIWAVASVLSTSVQRPYVGGSHWT
mmetsp:Transcript_28008/g.70485  ORF Transcript_28008/g.70485 Transcript_28008/m.70485 type:complete len:352 (+) Transcript_28008:3188-4243(+)